MPVAANVHADDYYAVLGVTKDASDADIAKAYKKLALKHHPDKNQDRKEQAEEEFKKVTEAYDVLRSAEKRQIYDQVGKAGLNGGNPQSGEPDSFPGSSGGQHATMSREEADEIFRAIFGGGESFGNMFGQGHAGRSQFVFQTGGPGGAQGFSSFGNGFEAMNMGGMSFGGGFPRTRQHSSTFAQRVGQSNARNRSRRENSRPQRRADSHIAPCGTPVVVHSLTKSITHNGEIGHISDWDTTKQRYEVTLQSGDDLVGDKRLWLRPQNITQLCAVEITALINKPELNGSNGRINHYDASKHRYMVFIDDTSAVLSLQPANCILSVGTCVGLIGLSKSECNGKRGRIMSIDRAASRYTVECENGKQIKIKYENVLC